MMMATLIASCCNAGLVLTLVIWVFRSDGKKRKDHLERYSQQCGIWSWKFKPCVLRDLRWWMDRGRRMMNGWMDGGQIWIALGSNSGYPNKHMMSV